MLEGPKDIGVALLGPKSAPLPKTCYMLHKHYITKRN